MAKSNKEFEKFNIQNLNDLLFKNKELEQFNAERALDTGFKNKQLESALAELGLTAASDQAKISTDFDKSIFESQVKQKQNEQQSVNDLYGILNTALGNELIDPETRQQFENILGTKLKREFGVSSKSGSSPASSAPAPTSAPTSQSIGSFQSSGIGGAPGTPSIPGGPIQPPFIQKIGTPNQGADGGLWIYQGNNLWQKVS